MKRYVSLISQKWSDSKYMEEYKVQKQYAEKPEDKTKNIY